MVDRDRGFPEKYMKGRGFGENSFVGVGVGRHGKLQNYKIHLSREFSNTIIIVWVSSKDIYICQVV